MPQKQRTRLSPAARREQILEAAADVFGRWGYRQGALKDVADAVGLSVQGVLHYYPTKEDLLLSLLEHRNEARTATLDQILDEEGTVAMMRYILAENLAHPGFMRLFVTLATEATEPHHPAHGYFQQRYAKVHADLVRDLEHDRTAGKVHADIDPPRAAEAIIALSDGLQLQKLLRPDLDVIAAYDAAVAEFRPVP